MRHAVAQFHVLPLGNIAAIEAAASRTTRPWLAAAPIDAALRETSSDVREFPREGMMATWPLFYLCAREVIPFPQKYFAAPLAQRVKQGVEFQERSRTSRVMVFSAADTAALRDVMRAVSPTESDIFRYHKRQLEDALGVEAAEQRMREDATVPELVADCDAAFGWLLACLSRVDAASVGLLIVRDARRRRLRWLTRRCAGPGPRAAVS
jgi:hypothetical protein